MIGIKGESEKTCYLCPGELIPGMAYKEHPELGGFHIGCAAAYFKNDDAEYKRCKLKTLYSKKNRVEWKMN